MRRVDPKVYTKKYYLTDATGYKEFSKSFGKKLEPRLERIVKEIPPINNLKVLDIGCGRGELALWCVRNGAKKVIGIDYSKNAIKLANYSKNNFNNDIKKKVTFKVGDGKILKYKNKSFDAILLTEVMEHVYPEEQIIIFKEIYRVLDDGGYVFIHTAPSKWFNDFTYRFWCYPVSSILVFINNLITGNKYTNIQKPRDIRTEFHKIMHVNEPDYFSLKKLFDDSGFKGRILSTNVTISKPILSWKDKLFNSIVYLNPISYTFPLNVLWGNDYLVVLKKNN